MRAICSLVYNFLNALVHLFYELVLYLQDSGYQEMCPLKENHLCNLLTFHKKNVTVLKLLEEFHLQ